MTKLRYMTTNRGHYTESRTLQNWDEDEKLWVDVPEHDCVDSDYHRVNTIEDWEDWEDWEYFK